MSRCFPYPPPHFDESLIKSIKIHKEKEKAEKEARTKAKDEKKEKKREKKEKKREKANQIQVNSEHEEKNHSNRKYEDKYSLSDQELFCHKTINYAVEQLEGSGLTEEYKHDSPESSQDSNKRRKIVPSSSSHNVHGSVLRIKLSASTKGGDSGSQLLLTSRQGGDSGPPQLLPNLRKEKDSGPQHLLPTSRKERDCGPHQLLPTLRKERDSGSLLLPTSRQGADSATRLLPPLRLEGDSTAQLLPNSLLGDSGSLLPTSRQGADSATGLRPPLRLEGDSASRLLMTSRQGGDSCSQVLFASQPKPGLPLPSSKRKYPEPPAALTLAQVVQPAAQVGQLADHQPAVDEQPCFSGRSKEVASTNQEITVPLPKKKSSSSKRKGGRRWQKEQFIDLIENWNPPSLQLESSDTADDWLVTLKQKSISISNLVSVEGSESGTQRIPSQQPKACYLPELDMYQLPYVVPF